MSAAAAVVTPSKPIDIPKRPATATTDTKYLSASAVTEPKVVFENSDDVLKKAGVVGRLMFYTEWMWFRPADEATKDLLTQVLSIVDTARIKCSKLKEDAHIALHHKDGKTAVFSICDGSIDAVTDKVIRFITDVLTSKETHPMLTACTFIPEKVVPEFKFTEDWSVTAEYKGELKSEPIRKFIAGVVETNDKPGGRPVVICVSWLSAKVYDGVLFNSFRNANTLACMCEVAAEWTALHMRGTGRLEVCMKTGVWGG